MNIYEEERPDAKKRAERERAIRDAAIILRVPRSGDPEIDAIILESRRWNMATAILQGHLAAGNDFLLENKSIAAHAPGSTIEGIYGYFAVQQADALIAELSVNSGALNEQTETAPTTPGLLKWGEEYDDNDDNDNTVWVARSALGDDDCAFEWRVTPKMRANQIVYSLDRSTTELIMGEEGEEYDSLKDAQATAEEREKEIRDGAVEGLSVATEQTGEGE